MIFSILNRALFFVIISFGELVVAGGADPSRFILEFKNEPTQQQVQTIIEWKGVTNLKPIVPFDTKFFKKTYIAYLDDNKSIDQLFTRFNTHDLIKSVERPGSAELYTILQGRNNSTINKVNDNYFGYQWYFYNSNQLVKKNLNIHKTQTLYSKPHMDMSWKFVQNIKVKRKAIVAIIDSGAVVTNKDFKGIFSLNKKECKNSNIVDLSSTQDRDGNGYIADCNGWDFTAIDKKGNFTKKARQVTDEMGHGTHIVGLLAANINNKIGISGLSNNIKILPLKVVKKNFKNEKSTIFDRIVMAILYAVNRKVDVINMSMGWPLAGNSPALKKAIKEAQAAGITIVAAAGNNSHNKSIFPCASEGVICVGAYSVDGNPASFTNFGGHVDILAPGDEILSTARNSQIITNAYKGVEIKNGTSQASPLIAGVVALLKVQSNKKYTFKDILERLYFSARPGIYKEKYFLNGAINVQKFFSTPNRVIVRPSFKGQPLVVVKQSKGYYKFKLINYSSKIIKNIKLNFILRSHGVRALKPNIVISTLKPKQEKEIIIPLQVLDAQSSSFVPFHIQVFINGKGDGTYKHELTISKEQQPSQRFNLTKNIIWLDQPLRSMKYKGLNVSPKYPEFFQYKKSNTGLELNFIKEKEGKYTRLGRLNFPQMEQLVSIIKVDINFDGRLDYLITGYVDRTNKKFREKGNVFYAFYNSQLKPLFGSQLKSHWFLKAKGVIVSNHNELSFVHYQHPQLGSIKLPVSNEFNRKENKDAQGNLDPDLNPDFFEFDEMTRKRQVFYFLPKVLPTHTAIEVRLFETYKFRDKLSKKVKIRFDSEINYHGFLPQSDLDLQRGTAKFIISVGEGTLLSYYAVSLNRNSLKSKDFTLQRVDDQDHTILGFSRVNYFDLAHGQKPLSLRPAYFGNYSAAKTSAQLVYFDSTKLALNGSTGVRHKLELDYIVDQPLPGFYNGNERFSALLTVSNVLLVYQNNSQMKTFVTPIIRSSFLPQALFKESLSPVVISGSNGRVSPGYFVNATQIFSRSVYIWQATPAGLIAPINSNYYIPENCNIQNPHYSPSVKRSYIVYLCGQKRKNKTLNFIKL